MKFDFEEDKQLKGNNLQVNAQKKSCWRKVSKIIMKEDADIFRKMVKNISTRGVNNNIVVSPIKKLRSHASRKDMSIASIQEKEPIKKLRVSKFKNKHVHHHKMKVI